MKLSENFKKKAIESAMRYAATHDEWHVQSRFGINSNDARALTKEARKYMATKLKTEVKTITLTREDQEKLLGQLGASCLSADAKKNLAVWLGSAKEVKDKK
jgi:ribosomal protein L4